MSPGPEAVVVTCEHAGNRVPARWRALFAPHAGLLASHRGWDPGALPIARALALTWDAPMLAHHWTRLLVESNRSPGHPALFSTITKGLPPAEREHILRGYHRPHREAVANLVAGTIARRGRVIHIAVHTFTPVFDGVPRNADIGLLYDPRRPLEPDFCRAWQAALRAAAPGCRVRRNYPYRGAADGLTTHLRRGFPAHAYLGVEIEVSQTWATGRGVARRIAGILAATAPFQGTAR